MLNIARDSMAAVGFSPATRVFEAAGAGACLITDAWIGLELFLEDGEEVLVARDGWRSPSIVRQLTPARARAIGEAARVRILAEHTYARRGAQVDALLREEAGRKRDGASHERTTSAPLRWSSSGLSLSSSWGNGHATTYRALLKAFAERGP